MTVLDFHSELMDLVEQEVMACIGCNDCMLACPLPETQLVTIGELNAAIHQPTITNPNVIQFVTACTQCRQCVPVCPADLHRADMVLFNKIKVEDALPNYALKKQMGDLIVDSGWTLDDLSQHLLQIPLFKGASAADLRRTIMKSTLRQLNVNEILCTEGTFHERLYVVLDGAVEQTATTNSQGQQRILVMGPGSFHGEMAVMANQMEQFTVVAVDPSLILEIPKSTVYQLMNLSSDFEETMNELYRRRAVWTHARKSPILAALPEAATEQMLEKAELMLLNSGETVYKQGDEPHSLYLVRSGFLRVSRPFGRSDRVLLYFREGDAFGAVPLLVGGRNTITVQANTRSELIRIPGDIVKDVLNRFPQARSRLIAQAMDAEKILRSPEFNQMPAQAPAANTTHLNLSWTGLIDKGVLQGHEVLVIDQSICTNCNNCVDSCGRRHGYSRLERRGLQLGDLLFPSACRHCEDPVCLLCSVNGIVRLPNGEITIVEDNCIGCGSCASRCPYGNIRMHNVEDKYEAKGFSGLLMDLWHMMRGSAEAEPQPAQTLSATHHQSARVAVKCDLCAGYDDYACVTACPVGAAFRIDPVQAFNRDDLLIGLEMKQSA
ncbi:MAG TPA: cyclic nucleotide-binding domain-containing protein [Anaerolineae bacterium]|nr:cyclic nucleotide-binding domain-containing protein [Anaerolineae bacterium]